MKRSTQKRYSCSWRRSHQQGLSLIELMISVVIGMAIVITIGVVYLGATTTFRSLDASSRIQENVRFAFERMTHDIRMAGFVGCSHTTQANVINSPTAWQANLFGAPLIGYEEGTTFPTGVTGVLRGDALTILRADNSREYIVSTHNPPSAQFQLTANHDLKQGEFLVVTDCKHAALFQMTNNNNNNTIDTVNHNTGTGTPGNCTKGLGHPVQCTANGTPYEFAAGSRILRMTGVTYFIRNNNAGEPSLYRQLLGIDSSGNSTTAAEELVDGIEDMQLLYGVDTSTTANGTADVYVSAADVPTNAPGANLEEQWTRVLSVQISLLAVSKADQSVNTQIQDYVFNGNTVTPTDTRMRRAFTTTVAVRNRL